MGYCSCDHFGAGKATTCVLCDFVFLESNPISFDHVFVLLSVFWTHFSHVGMERDVRTGLGTTIRNLFLAIAIHSTYGHYNEICTRAKGYNEICTW